MLKKTYSVGLDLSQIFCIQTIFLNNKVFDFFLQINVKYELLQSVVFYRNFIFELCLFMSRTKSKSFINVKFTFSKSILCLRKFWNVIFAYLGQNASAYVICFYAIGI